MGLHVDIPVPAGNLFKLAIEASPNGALLVEPGGTIAMVNPMLEQQFSYAPNELIGQSLDILLPECLRSVYAEHWLGDVSNPQTRPTDGSLALFGRRKDGSQ